MIRNIGGVILGYLAMALFIFATFSVAYMLMGADGAFQPGSYEPSALWMVLSIVLSIIAAILGGFLCMAISKNATASYVLAGIVLVLGLVMAFKQMSTTDDPRPTVREGDVGNIEAMQNARQPTWMALLNPIIGAGGVVFGSRLKTKQSRPPEKV